MVRQTLKLYKLFLSIFQNTLKSTVDLLIHISMINSKDLIFDTHVNSSVNKKKNKRECIARNRSNHNVKCKLSIQQSLDE